MRSILHPSIMYALVAMSAAGATGISLSNFTPRLEDLSSDCEAVYTRTIQGCVASDFKPEKPTDRCSSACVQGLLQIQKQISQSCADEGVDKNSIIGVFLQGEGVPALCPGVEVTTVEPSSTQAPAKTTQNAQQPSSAEASSTPSASDASSSAAQSTSQAQQTTLATQPANPQQPPPTEGGQQQPPSSSSSAKPSSTPNSQKSNADSGGGSPFDVQATGTSSTVRTLSTAAIAGILSTAIFFSTFF